LRPFRLGDQIIVGETEGNVERIELRATQPRTYDVWYLVPNAEVFTAHHQQYGSSDSTRQRGTFIGYDSDLRY